MQAQPILIWNSARGVWEKPGTANLFCEHWEPYSETWPISGMTQNGQVFELPTRARPITDLEYLSSPTLRTPTASQGEGGALGEEEARKRGNTVGIRDQAMDIALANGKKVSRLPTPTTQDAKNNGGPSQFGRNTKPLNVEAAMLGTPQARDAKGRPGRQEDKNLNHDVARHNLLTNWGKFEPAIRRWEEVLGRTAPAPTKPDGKDEAHRLSSLFTEWLMGLPEGWITDVGLTRNEELKACGNGVVPQQAELALRVLLEGVSLPTGGGSK